MNGTDKKITLFIGRTKNPRAFKNIDVGKYIDYKWNKKARMMPEIFDSYLLEWDDQLLKLKKEICLFMDNGPRT